MSSSVLSPEGFESTSQTASMLVVEAEVCSERERGGGGGGVVGGKEKEGGEESELAYNLHVFTLKLQLYHTCIHLMHIARRNHSNWSTYLRLSNGIFVIRIH